jgi:hypothetical protein
MEDSVVSGALPLILIELVLVLGGVLAFGWWQLHSVKRDRARMLAERARRTSAEASESDSAQRPDPVNADRAPAGSAERAPPDDTLAAPAMTELASAAASPAADAASALPCHTPSLRGSALP